VIEVLSERLTENTHTPAPVSRAMVATEAGGVLFDELVHENTEQPTAVWGLLPDVTAWLQVEDSNTPFVLAVVNHEGGDVATYVSDSSQALQETSVGDTSEIINKVKGGGWGTCATRTPARTSGRATPSRSWSRSAATSTRVFG
jgi:hypothetical protein